MSRLSKDLPIEFNAEQSAAELVWLATVDQSAKYAVGRIYTAEDGKAYVYLKGVASCIIGSVVAYKVVSATSSTTVLVVTGSIGHVGVAMSAVIAGDFGWFQIAGLNLVVKCDTSATLDATYIGGTAGWIDDTAVAGDLIHGMQLTVVPASNVAGVFMTYPDVTDTSAD